MRNILDDIITLYETMMPKLRNVRFSETWLGKKDAIPFFKDSDRNTFSDRQKGMVELHLLERIKSVCSH